MNDLFTTSNPQEWIVSGVVLMALGVVFMLFSKRADKTGGIGKGKITGNQAQRARSSANLLLALGALLAGFGICGMMGVFH